MLNIRNNAKGYGLVAISLHWIVALAFLVNYVTIYWREWFLEDPRSDFGRSLFSTHTAIGISVIVFVALRVAWKLYDRKPADPPGSKWEHLASHAVHIILYAVIIIIPLTGYLGTGGPSKLFFLFEVPSFKNTAVFNTVIEGWLEISWECFESVMDFIHKAGGKYVVWILILLHAGAALFHHFIKKDRVLVRMINPIEKNN